MPCPGPLLSYDLFNHVCVLCLFSYPDVCVLSRYVMFNILLSMFVYAAASSFFGWVLSISLLEERMNGRLVSSSMFQCYP